MTSPRGLAVIGRSRRGTIATDALYAGKLRDKPHKGRLDMFIGTPTGGKIHPLLWSDIQLLFN